MIGEHDTLRLAAGVTVEDGRLADAVRGASWPLNPSAAFVLAGAGRPLGAIVSDLAHAFALPLEVARADVLSFVWQLNALALVNVEPGRSRLRRASDWVQLAARLAPAGSFPVALARRRPVDTRTVGRAVASSLAACLPRAAMIATAAVLAAAQLGAIAGRTGLALPLTLGVATGLGLAVHEAAHAALLRGVPAALVTRGRRTYVLHTALTPARRALVALVGPLAVALLGVACATAGSATELSLLAVGGCPLAAHALALTVVAGDGRTACGL